MFAQFFLKINQYIDKKLEISPLKSQVGKKTEQKQLILKELILIKLSIETKVT